MRPRIIATIALLGLLGIGAVIGGSGGVSLIWPADQIAPPTYCATTNGTVSTGTAAGTITSIMYIFHPASDPKTYKIRYGEIHAVAGKDGEYMIRIAAITAENAAPGGTIQAKQPLVGTNPASAGAIVRTGATGAPTRIAGDYFTQGYLSDAPAHLRLDAITGFQPMTLLGGVAAGFELRSEVTVIMSTAAKVASWVCWTEEG